MLLLLLLLTVVLNRVDRGRRLDVLGLLLVDHVLLLLLLLHLARQHLSVALAIQCGGVVRISVDQIRAIRAGHCDVHGGGRGPVQVGRRGGVVCVWRLLWHRSGLWTDRGSWRLRSGRGGRCSELERLPSAKTLQNTSKVSC